MTNTPPQHPGDDQQPQQPYQGAQQQPQQYGASQPYQGAQQPQQQYGAPQQPYGGAQPQPSPYPGSGTPYAPMPSGRRLSVGMRVLIIVGGVIVALVVSALVRTAISGIFADSTEDTVQKAVSQLKESSDLPKQVDSITTWTGVEAEGTAIHYEYTISSTVDPAQVSTSRLRQSVAPTLCTTKSTKDLLDDGVSMRYSYGFDGSSKTIDFTVTKADC